MNTSSKQKTKKSKKNTRYRHLSKLDDDWQLPGRYALYILHLCLIKLRQYHVQISFLLRLPKLSNIGLWDSSIIFGLLSFVVNDTASRFGSLKAMSNSQSVSLYQLPERKKLRIVLFLRPATG